MCRVDLFSTPITATSQYFLSPVLSFFLLPRCYLSLSPVSFTVSLFQGASNSSTCTSWIVTIASSLFFPVICFAVILLYLFALFIWHLCCAFMFACSLLFTANTVIFLAISLQTKPRIIACHPSSLTIGSSTNATGDREVNQGTKDTEPLIISR